jgi:hypothetical protein
MAQQAKDKKRKQKRARLKEQTSGNFLTVTQKRKRNNKSRSVLKKEGGRETKYEKWREINKEDIEN